MTSARVELYARLPATDDLGWWRDLAAAAPDGRVLYVGCGTGRLAAPMARACRELVAVDHDARMLETFARRLRDDPELVDRVRLVEADASSLAVDGTFGLVVLPSNLLNGIIDPGARTAAVRAAARHCRPDGRVVLQVLNPYWMACQDPSVRGRVHPADGGPPIDVAIRRLGFDPWEQRQRAIITYRFADGEELTDDVDAVALYPRELRALALQAGLVIAERWGARPGRDDATTDAGSWHLVCRPRTTG